MFNTHAGGVIAPIRYAYLILNVAGSFRTDSRLCSSLSFSASNCGPDTFRECSGQFFTQARQVDTLSGIRLLGFSRDTAPTGQTCIHFPHSVRLIARRTKRHHHGIPVWMVPGTFSSPFFQSPRFMISRIPAANSSTARRSESSGRPAAIRSENV